MYLGFALFICIKVQNEVNEMNNNWFRYSNYSLKQCEEHTHSDKYKKQDSHTCGFGKVRWGSEDEVELNA